MSGDGRLTHVRADGSAHMVDVSAKTATKRTAVARGAVHTRGDVIALIAGGGLPKGDALPTARVAGIMAAKRTSDLIPLCHPLLLNQIAVTCTPNPAEDCVDIEATVRVSGKTGVEMEALTAASVACLTVYDMLKAADKGMTIETVRLLTKSGGKSGDWARA